MDLTTKNTKSLVRLGRA